MIGRTISHYQILERLGEGGMGVVYKARDTHLGRFVAIKVLPPERVADPERRRRFVQEARAASALNHPNIVHIYDIDRQDEVDYIAMESVEGRTLGEAIGRKGLKMNEALRLAVQIADALSRAHEAGIIHRDLKPANVMVDQHGVVKVLDFGLAKLAETVPPGADEPTRALAPTTGEGTVVGTAAYMSPEQASGSRVDSRSDIFSFGAVLYEMLTGRRAFQKESRLSTLEAILCQDPERLGAEIPHDLERIVRRCLHKDPARRFQHMDDVKVALEELREESDAGRLAAPAMRASARRRGRRFASALALLALAVLIVASVTIWRLARQPAPLPVPVPTRLTSDSGLTTDPALTPDGKLLAYASDRAGEDNLDIWVQQVGGEAIRLTEDTADESEPAFSPDGTRIAFRSERESSGVYVVPALGGPVRRIAPGGRRPQFSPDGNWIAYWTGELGGGMLSSGRSRIFVVASNGGTPRQIQPQFAGACLPIWTPDGRRLLFLGNQDDKLPPDQSVDWWATPIAEGAPARTGLLDAARAKKLEGPLQVYPGALTAPAWGSGGRSLIFSARSGDSTNLWRIGISPEALKATGTVERLTFGTAVESWPAAAATAESDRVAFASLVENIDIWSLPLDANRGQVTGGLQRVTQGADPEVHPSLSPDGERMVFLAGAPGAQDVWIRNLRSGEQNALTFTRVNKYVPRFSPDGSRVSYAAYEDGQWNSYVVPASGGASELLCKGWVISSWRPGGQGALVNTPTGRVGFVEFSSGGVSELLAARNDRFYQPHLSPDGRWFTFIIAGQSRYGVYVTPFQDRGLIGEREWIAVAEGATGFDKPRWSPDGSLLYYTSDRDGFRCIYAQRLDAATKRPAGAPLPIYHSHNARLSIRNMEIGLLEMFVGRDKLAFSMGERKGNIWMIAPSP